MSCNGGHEGSIVEPAQDLNISSPAAQATGTANPPVPADHQPATPEFLLELIRELDALRQRDSELWADMYPPMHPGQVSKTPPYLQREQARREADEIQRKMSALKYRIQQMAILIARQPPAAPELDKAAGPQYPVDVVTQAEVLTAPAFPLQKPSEPFTPAEPPRR